MNHNTYTALSTYTGEYQTFFKNTLNSSLITQSTPTAMLALSYGCSSLSNYCECDKKTIKTLLAKENILHHSVHVIKQNLLLVRNIFQNLLYKLLGRNFFCVTGSASSTLVDKLCCPVVLKKGT